MKRLVVLGAGTAGTMVVNKLHRVLPRAVWEIVVVEPSPVHLYQPGLLFLPFGRYEPADLVKPNQPLLPPGVSLVRSEVERVDTAANQVLLVGGGFDRLRPVGNSNGHDTETRHDPRPRRSSDG